jgi:hypothetical protein
MIVSELAESILRAIAHPDVSPSSLIENKSYPVSLCSSGQMVREGSRENFFKGKLFGFPIREENK